MAIDNGYCTLPEIRKWVSITEPTDTADDTELEEAVNTASRWIDQFTQRHFWQTATVARTLDVCACGCLEVELGPFNDLHELTSLKTDDDADGTYETTWSAADYQLLPLNRSAAPEQRPYDTVRAIGDKSFPTPSTRLGLVEITGKWGWAAIPADVTEACLIQASRIFKRKHSPEGVVGWGGDGIVRVSTRVDPDVESLLKPYCHPATAVLVA